MDDRHSLLNCSVEIQLWVRIPPGSHKYNAPVAQLYSSNVLLNRRSWVRVPPGVQINFDHVKRN